MIRLPARHGRRKPSICHRPRYASSAGKEAVRLAATAGLVMDGWQQDILTDSLGEDRHGKWAAFECGLIVSRQQGKGSVLEARVLAGLLLFGERLILWSAHETKTAFEAFRRCEELFTSDPELKKLVKSVHRSNGNEGIELHSGARLRFVARTKGSGRGFSADLVILDEAYALTAEQMAALIPTLSSRPNPQIWYTSSPPLDGLTGDQLYRLRARALAADEGLVWYDYGLQGVDLDTLEKIDLDDDELVYATNPALGIRIPMTFVRRERATMPAIDYARERLGVWPKQITAGAGVIDLAHWSTLVHLGRPETTPVYAVDINPARSHAAIVSVRAHPDDAGELAGVVQIALVAYEAGTDWIVPRLNALRKLKPLAIAVDVKGPGGSLLLDLQEQGFHPPEVRDEPKMGDLAIPNAQDVAAGFGLFVDAVRQKTIRHSDDAPLNLALAGAETRSLVGGTAWDRGKGGADISPLVAATVGYWAFQARRHLLVVPKHDLMRSFY